MPVLTICHFNLRAPRELLDSLCEFYCNVVGLTVGERPAFASFGYWLYAGAKDVLHLTEAKPNEQRNVSAKTTFDHIAFACTDSASYEARLSAAGIEYASDVIPGTGCVQIFFNDPAGNGVELNFAAGGG